MVAYHELLLHTTYMFFTYELSIQLNPLLLISFLSVFEITSCVYSKTISSHLNIHCIIAFINV